MTGRLLRAALAPAARRALRDRFRRDEIARVLTDALATSAREWPELPREPQPGPRWLVRLAALTAALYRALLDRGVAPAEARRLTARVTWLVYEQMARVPWALARLTARTPHGRLARATGAFRRFPFQTPGYDMVDVTAEPDVVAFDVRRCPVAAYFRAQGLSELCVDSWCNLDVPLARRWGARLERTTTLAQGADRCDFRWRVDPPLDPRTNPR